MSRAMKPTIAPLLLVVCLSSTAAPQTTKRRGVVRKPAVTAPQPQPVVQPQPTPTSQPPRPSAAPVPLVVVNGQTFTTADLDPAVRQEVESLNDKIAAARKSVLDVQINTLLLEVEAKRRHIDTHRLYELEVSDRVGTITPAQIKKFLDENKEQFEGVDPALASKQAAAYLHDELENKLADDLVNRLRKTNPVIMGVDVNSPNLNPAAVVATVAGQPLKADSLIERLKPIIYRMKLEAYELTKQRVDQLVDDTLLLEEARRRQIGPEEIIRTEISDKVRNPTDDEVNKFYSENKARIAGDLNSIRNQLVTYLQNESRQQLEKDFSARLRKGADIRWVLTEPPQPEPSVCLLLCE